MTIGIYALYWEEQDLIYIGQSQNIETRFKEHLYKLKNDKHTNYKVQNAFTLYGYPELVVLEVSSIEYLNDLEILWTKEFNALDNGLNIVEAGSVGYGTNSNNSIYSKRQILKVFSLLVKHSIKFSDIEKRTKVPKHVINDISLGNSHLWLLEQYPAQYYIAMSRPRLTSNIFRKTGRKYSVISPSNEIFVISNITEFCRSIQDGSLSLTSLVRGFARLLDGTRKQYKGWRLQ